MKFFFIILALLSILLLGSHLPPVFFNNSIANDASIGIIGGADGPTAIFVTSTLSTLLRDDIIILSIAVLLVCLIGIFVIRKR